MPKFHNKKILITGASSGIGRAVAFELANKGARLALNARNIGRLEQIAKEIGNRFPQLPIPYPMACDISQPESVREMIRDCIKLMGHIDILINNAGIGIYGATEKTTLEDFRQVMEVNFFGSMNCILEVLPVMKKTGTGLIVNITSVAAINGIPFLGVYCASKAALASLGQSLRAELTGTGISIMNVYPGYTETNFFVNEKKVGGARRPEGPYASPEKVARTIVRSIEKGKREVILTLEGKALLITKGIAPVWVEKQLGKIAERLKEV
jgi:short-subunit dehydrogenase